MGFNREMRAVQLEIEQQQNEAVEESGLADGIYPVIMEHRRYFCTMVGDVEVSIRVPLHVWESKNYDAYTEYAESLAQKVVAEKRRQLVIEKKPANRLD